MRTLSVPWRVSKHERFALRHGATWWSLGVATALAVAALVLALVVAR